MKQRDLHYKIWSVRLSEDNLDWLRLERENFGSWNKFFNSLIKSYEKEKKISIN